MAMGSRRTITRSVSGNGRFPNGAEVSGSSRSPGCSYISNVRPETRSTLCSVIAQLTEETQPFFEVTLKSKAVSESSTVKFSCVVTGYPTPQVTWYKDDIQLDRYCGLPKYEVFRNGQNHSLHIYNCTVEDAAIYQASATNTKGIVSCSGILEVGEMNEFKIHQRYFSKLKQKAENKRREAEEKENQEPVRTISPDRAQRKRRSTVGGYISAPCSTEEDISEKSQQEATAEARVLESNVEKVNDTKGTTESEELHSNTVQDAKDSCSIPSTHKNDAPQKIFTNLQPKTFFKKFKISSPKVGPEDKKSTVDSLPQSHTTPKGSMEVESSVSTTSVLPQFKSLKRRVASIGSKQGSSQEKVDRKTAIGDVKVQNGSPSNNSSPVIPTRTSKQQQPQSKIKEEMNASPKAKEKDTKAKGSPPDTDASCDSGTALRQPPCQQARHDPPQKETRPAQKEGCVPEQKREATQAHAKAQRNGPLVDLERQAKLHSAVAPEKTPAKRTEQDRRSPSLRHGLHKTNEKRTQDTQDHSRGSSKLCTDLLPDTEKSTLESPKAGNNRSECNIAPAAQQSQLNTPIKTAEGKEIQLDEKVTCNEAKTSIVKPTSVAPKEVGGMEIAQEKNADVNANHDIKMDLPNTEKESKSSIETVAISSGGKDTTLMTNNKSEMLSDSESKDFQKCPSPIPNILSIAELLRSQINALEESVSSRITPKDTSTIETIVESDSNSAKKTSKDTCIDKGPPQTIKETLMQIYNELIKTKELFADEALALQNCVQPTRSLESPPLDNVSTEKTLLSTDDVNKHTPKNCLPEMVISLKVNGHEVPKNDSVQNNDTGAKGKQTPEILLNSDPVEDTVMIAEPFISNGKTQESMSSLEPVQVLPVQSVSDNQKESPANGDSVIVDDLPCAILETSPSLKKKDCVSVPSATPQELASGARRKIPSSHKTKLDDQGPCTPNKDLNPSAAAGASSPGLSRHPALLLSSPEQASPKKKRSPLLGRKKSPVEMLCQETQGLSDAKSEENLADKAKNDPFKAPQVIRKIRGETFSDHSGNMKLWCQFFNVLSESTVTWHRDELAIAKMLKGAGDETQVNLALAQATSHDTGVYGCTITNEYGTDSTDFLLSAEVLAGMSLREDLGVGEEIELTPLLFNKGVADCVWGNKLFGRVMVQESHLGAGFSHKTWKAKVIYGLEPVFESGNTCIIKISNPIAYGGKGESLLIEKNHEVIKQACKIQNLAREYCKIFSAEARAAESFGFSLEVIPVYLVYRPANSIPYATVEADLMGAYSRHCGLDPSGKLDMRSTTEVEQKCCALQHWIFQWTSGNMLFTKLEGVDSKVTNVGISVKSSGHQGLSIEGNPKVFEQFVIQHQCNYFCGLLGLRSLKVIESLLMPGKPKGSKSPLLQRKMGSGASSPQTGRKTSASPRTPRKMEQDDRKTPSQSEHRAADESRDTLSVIH